MNALVLHCVWEHAHASNMDVFRAGGGPTCSRVFFCTHMSALGLVDIQESWWHGGIDIATTSSCIRCYRSLLFDHRCRRLSTLHSFRRSVSAYQAMWPAECGSVRLRTYLAGNSGKHQGKIDTIGSAVLTALRSAAPNVQWEVRSTTFDCRQCDCGRPLSMSHRDRRFDRIETACYITYVQHINVHMHERTHAWPWELIEVKTED